MDRIEKTQIIESLQFALKKAGIVILTRQSRLTVEESLDLRRKMRASNAHFKVAKNTLMRLAVKNSEYESLLDYMKGPTALAYSEDPVSAAKVISEFIKKNDKLEIVCGVMQGTFLNANGIQSIATLPSLPELRSIVVGLIQSPATKIARIFNEPAAKIARVIGAHSRK